MYDASLHPDVLHKRRTADEAMREFLDGFSGGCVGVTMVPLSPAHISIYLVFAQAAGRTSDAS